MAGGSRRPHVKSRLGCKNCKRRKIKCDARGPCCGNCEKRKIVCEYADFTITRPNNAPPWEQSGSQHVFSLLPAQPKPVTADLQFDQLELMHQWTTSTSVTVIRVATPDIKDLWQVTVPQLAQRHRFIMHSILGISAAHLGYLKPLQREKYQRVARQHHVDASAAFRTASSSGIERPSSEPALIFCILHMVTALALLPDEQNNISDLEHFVGWLLLLRTSLKLARSFDWNPEAPEGSIQNIMSLFAAEQPSQFSIDPGLQESLIRLEAFNASSSPPNDRPVFAEAIAQTRKWFTLVPLHPPNLLYLLRWVALMPDAYLDLVTKRSSLGLVLLAHWIIPLRNAPRKWMLGDWPERAIDAIRKQVGDAWTGTMQWVVEQIETDLTYQRFDDMSSLQHILTPDESANSEDSSVSPPMIGVDGTSGLRMWQHSKWNHLW